MRNRSSRLTPSMASLLTAFAVLFGATTSPAQPDVGSPFPPGATELVAATDASQSPAERANALLEKLNALPAGSRASDLLSLKVAAAARQVPDVTARLLARCDNDQLERLAKQADEDSDFRAVLLFGGEFRSRVNSPGMHHAAVTAAVARAHMVLDNDSNGALNTWITLAGTPSALPESKAARIYIEAVLGPKSVAAIEAADELGRLQAKHGDNPLRAKFSSFRVLEAAEKPFFQEYLASPAITAKDKSELLYTVLFNAQSAGQYEKVRSTAGAIFSLVGYDTRPAERAAFAVGMSHAMQRNYVESARQFEAYLRYYPNSESAPEASLWLGRSYQLDGQVEDAAVQFAVTARLYPGTDSAAMATRIREALLLADTRVKGLAAQTDRETGAIAKLKKPLRPEEAWPASPPEALRQVALRDKATTGGQPAIAGPKAPEPRPEHQRLAAVTTIAKGGE